MNQEITSRRTFKRLVLSGFVLFVCANCNNGLQQQTDTLSSASSSSCPVNPAANKLTELSADGDHVIFAPEGTELRQQRVNFVNEQKVYLNDSTSPINAPKWETSEIKYYYNHAGAPSNFSKTQVEGLIKSSISHWTAVCGIKFTYMGESTAPVVAGTKDGLNVITWGNADGASGVTYSYWKTTRNSPQLLLSEADIDMSVTDVRDATTFEAVLNHEMGHMLGLNHSDVSESIMFANPYHTVQYLLTLRNDDIQGCQGLYGAPAIVTPSPSPSPAPSPSPSPAPSATPKPVPSPMPPMPSPSPSPSASPTPTVPPSTGGGTGIVGGSGSGTGTCP